METVYDPLRRKEVAATPEERVRQWFISVLRDGAGVPAHMMMSEVGFKFGDKQFRADILAYGTDGKPLLIVECKRPDVELDEKVVRQALRYDMVLSVKYIMIANGTKTIAFARKGERFEALQSLPGWEAMKSGSIQ